ncbi:MAG: TonB-dependent receptor [Bacteroidales bacterium]|nr:TonB-dependent receptor [Bacteroidales bacterium]
MKRVMLLLVFFYSSFVVFGQFQVSGIVEDTNGTSLIGANVILEGTYLGTSTGLSGEFVFSNVNNGSYTLKVSYMGYETKREEINVQKNSQIKIALERSIYLADEVIISTIRASETMPVASTTVSKSEIREMDFVQDVPYLLRLTPSLVTSSDAGTGVGYTSFRIRGTDLTRINITVNGIPLNDSESHGVWWVDMPDFSSSVDNIQIQRGVGTSTNGAGAFGATVNLKTFTFSKKPFTEINSIAGSLNTLKNNIKIGSGLINDKFSFETRMSKVSSDGYIDRATADLKSFAVSGAYFGEKDMVRVNILSGKEKTFQAWDGVPSTILDYNRTYNGMGQYLDEMGNTKYYDNETDNYWQDHFQLLYSREIKRGIYLNLCLHYSGGKGYYEQYKEDEDYSDYQMDNILIGSNLIEETDLIRRKWLDNDFYGVTYSLKYKKDKWDASIGGAWNKYIGGHFGKVIWARYAGDSELNHEWYNSDATKADINLYGKINYYLSTKLNLYADMQTRHIDYIIDGIDDDLRNITQKHTYTFFNPKLGTFLKLNKNQSAYFSFGIAHREPNRHNFVDADPAGPVPVPEMLKDYELGYNLRLSDFRFTGNIYFMDYDNQLVLTGEINDVGSPVMTNVEKSYRTGIELQTAIQIADKIEWEMNATLSRNKIKNFTEYVDNWDTWSQVSTNLGETDISFSPAIIMGSNFKFNLFENFEIRMFSKYVGKQYIDNTSGESRILNPWFVNDLNFQYSFSQKWVDQIRVKLQINNLFNEEYETNAWVYRYIVDGENKIMDGYFPQASRNFLVGLNFRF